MHSLLYIGTATERKFYVEDPEEPMNEYFCHMIEIGNYEILSNFLAPIKKKFKGEIVCNIWDTMDSFDGLFLKETPCENDIGVAPSESGTGSDLSVVSALSALACQLSNGSSNSQDELENIIGPFIPYVLEHGEIYFGKEENFDTLNKH
jgi:hypothetical protein